MLGESEVSQFPQRVSFSYIPDGDEAISLLPPSKLQDPGLMSHPLLHREEPLCRISKLIM